MHPSAQVLLPSASTSRRCQSPPTACASSEVEPYKKARRQTRPEGFPRISQTATCRVSSNNRNSVPTNTPPHTTPHNTARMTKTVVILGGSVAGLHVAHALLKKNLQD